MPNTSTFSTTLNRAKKNLRTRTGAMVATGVCASVAVTGVSVAAGQDGGGGSQGTFSPHTVSDVAKATGDQVSAQKEAAKKWVSPISDDYSLSASFGNSGDRWASGHSGQDFAVPTGTDVDAVHGGTVVKAGGNGAGDGPAYGNAVVIKHSDDTYTQYAHLSEIDVDQGETVTTGEHIAKSGNTGNSSGPHLHFEVRTTPDYGSAIDPVAFLKDEGVSL
ncbi:M23 family metallopeptidase [Streptomyces sp. SBT349]|uniref:M23 family metallopeptidase n=1 Tax=Streptomyces sp. SBT349 TaxID=1580539 RepID=UPI00066E46E3|nr:M23 family metallopeptidase [Streptomyces sp. SBT349]